MRLLSVAALLLTACTGGGTTDGVGETGDDTGGGDDTGDTGEEQNLPIVEDLTATFTPSSQVSTVGHAEWSTPEAGNSVVEWGYDTDYGFRTVDTDDSATDHRVLVWGFPAREEIHWRVRSTYGGQVHVSPDQTYQTGAPDSTAGGGGLRDAVEGAYTPGFRLLALGSTPSPIVLYTDDGNASWVSMADSAYTVPDSQVSRDGKSVLYLVLDRNRTQDIGGIVRVPIDRPDNPEVMRLSGIHHAFTELPDGSLVYLGVDARTQDRMKIYGDTVMVADADGRNATEIFNVWDHFAPDTEALSRDNSQYYPDGKDWTHGNSIHYNEDDDTFILSLHNLGAVLKITRSGDIVWQMGGDESTMELQGGADTSFMFQHNPQLLANGNVLMFDNGNFQDRSEHSEASEYRIDPSGGTYERVWNFDDGEAHLAQLMGDVTRMANGNTFVNWGAAGQLTEVTEDGEIVWDWQGDGSILGFTDVRTQLGVPD